MGSIDAKLPDISLLKKIWSVLLVSGLLVLGSMERSAAQTWNEWWSQKKTQIKYLGQQIAALQQLRSYVQQGYQITQHGLGAISGFSGSEMNLHSSYYRSSKMVNPAVKDDVRATSIASYAEGITLEFDHLNRLAGLKVEFRHYLTAVKAKVLDEVDADIGELQLVMTSGEAELTDDERIKRLDQISIRMKDKYAFSLNFCNQVRLLVAGRNREVQTIKTIKQYDNR